MKTWRYISPEILKEGDDWSRYLMTSEGLVLNHLFALVVDYEWDLVLNRLSCLWKDLMPANANIQHWSDEDVEIVKSELNGIDPETGNTILHTAIDSQAPFVVIKAMMLQNPFSSLGDLVPFEESFDARIPQCRPLAAIVNHHGDTALHRVTFNSSDVQLLKLVCLAYPQASLTKNNDESPPAFYACSMDSPLRAISEILEGSTTGSEEIDGSIDSSSLDSANDQGTEEKTKVHRLQGKVLFNMLKKCPMFDFMESKDSKRPFRLLSVFLDVCPREALRMTDAFNCTLHHFGLLKSIDDEGLALLCQIYPEGCQVQNKFGCTPLQAAVRMKTTFHQIKMLVNCFPNACSLPNNLYYLPLGRAAQNKMSMEVMEFLLDMFPLAPLFANKKGLNSFDLLDIAYDAPKTFAPVIQDPMSDSMSEEFHDWWDRATLMMKYIAMTRDPQKLFRPLHAIMSMEVTKTMLNVGLWYYPLHLREVDEDGRFPLHIACATKNVVYGHGIDPVEEVVVVDDNAEHIVISLMRIYPDPVRHVDNTRCLPLHLAIKSGLILEYPEVMESLLVAAPSSIDVADGETNLFPFQSVASLQECKDEHAQLQAIYRLLRASPWLVNA